MKRTKSPRRKPRGRASKTPPFTTLGQAIKFTRIIFEEGGGRMSISELAKAAKQAPTSSTFHRRVAVAKAFGLLKTVVDKRTKERRVRIEDVARRILAPHSPKERQEGKYEALISIPEFKKLLEIYQDAVPENEYIANVLGEEFQIPDELRNDWVDCFIASCMDAGIIYDLRGKAYFSKPESGVKHEAEASLGVTADLAVDQTNTPSPNSAELRVVPPSVTYEESALFNFPPTTLVGGTVSNISFVNMDRITPEGIEQFIKVTQGIADFLKARIPEEKKEGDHKEIENALEENISE